MNIPYKNGIYNFVSHFMPILPILLKSAFLYQLLKLSDFRLGNFIVNKFFIPIDDNLLSTVH